MKVNERLTFRRTTNLLVCRRAGQVARDVLVEVAFESVLRPGEGPLVVEVGQDQRDY